MGLPLWLGDVPEYRVTENGEDMLISMGDFSIAMPIPVFLVGCAKGTAAIEYWKAKREPADVIPFPSRFRSEFPG
jgi:hypothetical protein